MKIIKRYPNRKLYDLDHKQYVTLDDIAFMIQEGKDVQVIDHESGEDLTSVTLSQIIFEREKKRAGFLPQSILTSLVRTGGDTLEYLRRSFHSSLGALRLIEQEIDSRIENLVAKGELAQEEAERLRREIYDSASAAAREVLPDLSIEAALERLNVPTSAEVRALQEQVERLMAQVDLLLQGGVGADARPSSPPHGDDTPTT
ncbi:MAG: pesticidal protein Cry15Aa [Caldilineales bacterium]|nr:pesticidal protein Cry15Aa [Caldilineales bacterium]